MKCIAFIAGLVGLSGTAMAQFPGSGLVVLHPTASGALSMTGNSEVLVPTYAVYVNSSSSTAVTTVGRATLQTPDLYIVGTASFTGGSGCTGVVHQSSAPYTNPFQHLSLPTTHGMTNYGTRNISSGAFVRLDPGYYSGGVSVTGNSTVMFNPGTYIFGGTGLQVNSGVVFGNGVSLIMQSGMLDLGGNGSINFSPQMSGNLAGIVIAQPETNTTLMQLRGGSDMYLTGAIYVPGATLRLVGNSTAATEGPQMGDLVVANKVELTGTAQIKIGRENMQAVMLPKLPLFD